MVMAEPFTALCRRGGADLSAPAALTEEMPLGAWVAIAAARMGLAKLLWAARTPSAVGASIAGLDWGPAPGSSGDTSAPAKAELAAYMSQTCRIRRGSLLDVALWRQAVIAAPANNAREQRSARGVPASEAIQEAAEFQRDAVAAQAAWFQQRVAGLYADQVAVAQQQRSRETMSSYCRLDAGTNLCAITINTAALRELQSLHTGWWADQQRQQQQAAAQLMQELGVGGEPEAQEAARAAALAEAQAAAAAVPAGLVATAASACAALGNGGAMVGAAGWLLRRRRCAEAAAAVGEAARTVQGMLAGMAVGRPGAAALAAALVEQRFARMASTAAAEAFGSTPAAQAAVSAALDLGRSYDGGGGGPAMAPMLFDRHFPRGSKVLAFGMVVGLQHAREWAARHSQAEFSIPRPPLLALAEMGAAPSLQQLQQQLPTQQPQCPRRAGPRLHSLAAASAPPPNPRRWQHCVSGRRPVCGSGCGCGCGCGGGDISNGADSDLLVLDGGVAGVRAKQERLDQALQQGRLAKEVERYRLDVQRAANYCLFKLAALTPDTTEATEGDGGAGAAGPEGPAAPAAPKPAAAATASASASTARQLAADAAAKGLRQLISHPVLGMLVDWEPQLRVLAQIVERVKVTEVLAAALEVFGQLVTAVTSDRPASTDEAKSAARVHNRCFKLLSDGAAAAEAKCAAGAASSDGEMQSPAVLSLVQDLVLGCLVSVSHIIGTSQQGPQAQLLSAGGPAVLLPLLQLRALPQAASAERVLLLLVMLLFTATAGGIDEDGGYGYTGLAELAAAEGYRQVRQHAAECGPPSRPAATVWSCLLAAAAPMVRSGLPPDVCAVLLPPAAAAAGSGRMAAAGGQKEGSADADIIEKLTAASCRDSRWGSAEDLPPGFCWRDDEGWLLEAAADQLRPLAPSLPRPQLAALVRALTMRAAGGGGGYRALAGELPEYRLSMLLCLAACVGNPLLSQEDCWPELADRGYGALCGLVEEAIMDLQDANSSAQQAHEARTARLINLSCKLEVAFFYACLKGDATAVGSMLDGEDGVDVDATDSGGRTGLFFAASAGHLEVVELLIEKGADVNLPCEKTGHVGGPGGRAQHASMLSTQYMYGTARHRNRSAELRGNCMLSVRLLRWRVSVKTARGNRDRPQLARVGQPRSPLNPLNPALFPLPPSEGVDFSRAKLWRLSSKQHATPTTARPRRQLSGLSQRASVLLHLQHGPCLCSRRLLL
eukprot:XP_001692323.1 predicted protein [Chlamydomonas reinhardtii]